MPTESRGRKAGERARARPDPGLSKPLSILSTSAARRFHRLLDGDPEAVLLTDAAGRVLGANPAACSLFRCMEPDICAAGWSGLLSGTDPHIPGAGNHEPSRDGSWRR